MSRLETRMGKVVVNLSMCLIYDHFISMASLQAGTFSNPFFLIPKEMFEGLGPGHLNSNQCLTPEFPPSHNSLCI